MTSTAPPTPDARAVVLVFAGGAVGTVLRALILAVQPPVGGLPVGTVAVDVVGAFLLGLLLGALGPREDGRARRLRELVGTGVLGGFTTYSAFATDTALLAGERPALAITSAAVTVVMGLGAALAGLRLGARS